MRTNRFDAFDRAIARLRTFDADTASKVQAVLDHLAIAHDQHADAVQRLGNVIGVMPPYGRANIDTSALAPNVPAHVAAAAATVVDTHKTLDAAHHEAVRTIRSLFGMGGEPGLKIGMPDDLASIDDMNPSKPLGEFHGDLSVYGADPDYPAAPSVPGTVVGRSKRRHHLYAEGDEVFHARPFTRDGGDAA